MARNLQIKKAFRGADRFSFLLLLLTVCLTCSGCRNQNVPDDLYSFEARAGNFSRDSEAAAVPFASGLSVLTGEDNQVPQLEAEAAAVFDLSGGEAIFHKNALERMNPASTTKIMTAILALKNGNLDEEITVGDEVTVTEAGSSMCGVLPGETMTLRQLLYGLMLPSGNDAANAIAVHLAGSIDAFADMMNEEARRIGATGTHFVNANGLTDPDHYTTAYDLYLMFREALTYPEFREIIGTQSYTAVYTGADGTEKSTVWTASNYYMTGKAETPDGLSVFGGKTGTTSAAGYCLIMGCRSEDGHEYASVVMKAGSRDQLYDNMTKIISNIVK